MNMTDDLQRPDRVRRQASYLLNRTAGIASRLVTETLATASARRPHYSVLAALQEFGPSSQASLGRRCGIDRSDIVAIVNELEHRGMVGRAQDPSDRRRNTVTITKAGTVYLAQLDMLMDQIQAQLLAPLDEDEAATLMALLGRVIDHHGDREEPWKLE